MLRIAFFFLVPLLIAVVALIDCLSSEESDIRGLPRLLWVLVILLFPFVGGIAWFFAGRPVRTSPRPNTRRPGGGFPEVERPRQVAPDDDPEFLRRIAQSKKDDDDLMQRWEKDLRRREEELRRKDEREDDGDKPKQA
jgi:hypothetical protein